MNFRDLLASLGRYFRASSDEISRLVLTAPYQYKHYQIAKNNGGSRDIYHPTPVLKEAQRWLVANVLSELRVHPSVFSYRRGIGIRSHAEQHLTSNFLLHLDFSNFFPSITQNWLTEYMRSEAQAGRLDLDPNAIALVGRLLCRYNRADSSMALSIGAPSSPLLSNAVLFGFDERVQEACTVHGCVYTRYADDMYVSAHQPGILTEVEAALRAAVATEVPRLQINEDKTANLSRKARRVVTGLTLCPDRRLSVGRELKRSIRTRVFLYLRDQLPVGERASLCGQISFVRDVEPEFFEALSRKFGAEALERLFRSDYD